MIQTWLDFSEWQGRLSLAHMQYARAAGASGVIIQLWGSGPTGNGPNDYAEAQLAYATQAGLQLAGYIWVPPDSAIETGALYQAAVRAAGTLAPSLCFIAPDLEGARLHPTDPLTGMRIYNPGGRLTLNVDEEEVDEEEKVGGAKRSVANRGPLKA